MNRAVLVSAASRILLAQLTKIARSAVGSGEAA
jgi:hypothetical protein